MIPRPSATAPGKLLLFGEHAAVYGYPALGIALDAGVSLALHPADAWHLDVAPDTPGREAIAAALPVGAFFDHLRRVVSGAWDEPRATRITIGSDLPVGSGFGSSAALCVALARAWAPDAAPVREIWRVAHELETFFHGTPSGIDTGLSTLGGVQEFRFERPGELPWARRRRTAAATLVVGALPRSRSTRELVAMVRTAYQSGDAPTRAALATLGRIAERAPESQSAEAFGAAADEAQHHLAGLGLSTERLEQLLQRARGAGAYGAKLSGAGGGGAFFAVCGEEATARRVFDAWGDAARFLLPLEGAPLRGGSAA